MVGTDRCFGANGTLHTNGTATCYKANIRAVSTYGETSVQFVLHTRCNVTSLLRMLHLVRPVTLVYTQVYDLKIKL